MQRRFRRFGMRPTTFAGTTFLGLLIAGMALGEDQKPPKLDLRLTQAELRSFVRDYENRTGKIVTAPIDDDEVVVVAPHLLAPMRDVSQDVPGAIAAPFWAIMHPKDAWRIFVPIPPKPVRK